MKPSHRQQAVFDCWANEDKNILISAVAGSGKTTTLMQLLERSKTPTLFVAFNKTIQTEIQERIVKKGMKSYALAMTMHALGLRAIKRQYKQFRIKSSKGFKLVKKVESTNQKLYEYLGWEDKAFISSSLIAMNDISRMILSDNFDEVIEALKMICTPVSEYKYLEDLWKDLLKFREESYQTNIIEIDFADMIYLPVVKNLRIPVSPKHLMIDECQDLNLAQHKMIDKILSQGSVEKWIAVGDRNQSIYGFAGAHSGSFDLFLKKDNVVELPLDICYRCPSKIIESANQVYDVMKGFKTEEGILEKKKFEDIDTIPDNALIICRNTGPLIRIFFELIVRDRKVFLKGEDIIGELEKFLSKYLSMDFNTALFEMSRRREKLAYIAEKSKNPLDYYKYQQFVDNMLNFKMVVTHFEDRLETVSQLLSFIKTLYNDNSKEGVILSTIHKSKGLEADVVYILEEDLIPSKMAKTEEMQTQEYNLKYVARTRAKKAMYFLSIEEELKKQKLEIDDFY